MTKIAAGQAPAAAVPQVLDAAADYIDAHGFRQGMDAYDAVFTPGLPTCESVAIQIGAAHDEHRALAAFVALAAYLDVECPPGTPALGIVRWNDEPGRTKAEAVTALREAAEAARAEQ